MERHYIMTTIALVLAASQAAAPLALAGGHVPASSVLSIAGQAEGCRCCITQIGPLGIVHICKECHGTPCQCDFDALGLPRCTGSDPEAVA